MNVVTIKPGTARRLGLRPPSGPPLGVIRFPPMTPEKAWVIERAFKKYMDQGQGRWRLEFDVDVSPYPPSDKAWLGLTEPRRERRKRLGLHWWQRSRS